MLLCQLPLPSSNELSHESAFSTQTRSSNFSAGGVLQIIVVPVNFEAKMIPGMYHLWEGSAPLHGTCDGQYRVQVYPPHVPGFASRWHKA